MLTRVLFALIAVCAMTSAAWSEDTKIVALGIADHAVTQDELAKGDAPPAPHYNTAGVAYALASNLKKGDAVEVWLKHEGLFSIRNAETLAEDKPTYLLQAGKQGVPAGGWPEGEYSAVVKIVRDGKTLIEEKSKPIRID
jgi:hypothetical protein